MIELKRNSANSMELIEELRSISGGKCFYADLLLTEKHQSIYYTGSDKTYDNAYLLFNQLSELLSKGLYNLKEMINPFFDKPKHHIYIKEVSDGLSFAHVTPKGRKTIEFIYNSEPNTYPNKLLKTKKYCLEELEDILSQLKTEDGEVKKTAINRFWRLLNTVNKQDLSAVRATFILKNEDYIEIKDLIEHLDISVIDVNKKERALEEIKNKEIELQKISLLKSKYELFEKIKPSLFNCDYQTVINILQEEDAPENIIDKVDVLRKLFDFENINEQLILNNLSNNILHLENYSQQFNGIPINRENYFKIILYLNIAQKAKKMNKFKLVIQVLGYFFEKFCEAVGAGSDKGMFPKFKEIKSKGYTPFYDDIIETFRSALDAETHNNSWKKFHKIRNDIAHKGLNITEIEFNTKCQYLFNEVQGLEQYSNLANKWFCFFGIDQVENIFDTLNRQVEGMLKNPDFEPQTPPSTNEQ